MSSGALPHFGFTGVPSGDQTRVPSPPTGGRKPPFASLEASCRGDRASSHLAAGTCVQAGSVDTGARCSTCDQVPMSMGVPPTHREVWRERDSGIAPARVGTGCMAPGMVRSPHAEDLTQPSVHRGGIEKRHLAQLRGILPAKSQSRPRCREARTAGAQFNWDAARPVAGCKGDAGSTTRRASVRPVPGAGLRYSLSRPEMAPA